MLSSKNYAAYLLALLMAVPAYCSASENENEKTSEETTAESSDPGYTVTFYAVRADPEVPKFPRDEVTRGLTLFTHRYKHAADAKFYVRVADLLEKFPEGQAEESARNLLSLGANVPHILSLLEGLPAEIAPKTLGLFVKQGEFAGFLFGTIATVPSEQRLLFVNSLLSWPEGVVTKTLAAAYKLSKKHAPTLKNEQLHQLLLEVSLMLLKPLDGRGVERARTMWKFDSHIFMTFLGMSRQVPPTPQCHDMMIDILSQLNPGVKKVEARGQAVPQDQNERLPSVSPAATADAESLDAFFKALSVASSQHVAMCFKLAAPLINMAPQENKTLGGLKLDCLTIWLRIPENRMGTVLLTVDALSRKNPKSILNIPDVITVLKEFPEDKVDQLAKKLVYFCGDGFDKIIGGLVNKSGERAALILEKAYDLCQKRDVPLGHREQIIKSVLNMPEGKLISTLNTTETLFTAIERIEPRLKESFASHYKSVFTALRNIPEDRPESILQGAIRIMGIAYKDLFSHEGGALDSGDLRIKFNPGQVIDSLRGTKKEGLQAALETSHEFCVQNGLLDWYWAEIINAISWVKPEKMKAVIEAFEKILQKEYDYLPTQDIISQLGKLPVERMDEFVLAVKQVMTSYQDEVLNMDQMSNILASIVYVHPDQVENFVTGSIEFFTLEDEDDDDDDDDDDEEDHGFASNLVSHVTDQDEAGRGKLFQLWTHLLSGEEIDHAEKLCKLITENVMELGLNEEHPMVQLAIRVQSVLDNDEDDSPYVIYERLKQKRLEPIDWTALKPIKGGEEGLYVSLNHQGLAKFGSSIVMDLKSVPKVDATDFVAMVDRLKAILAADLQRSITPQLMTTKVLDLDDAAKSKAPLLLQAALMIRDSQEVELISRHEAGIIEEQGSDAEAKLQRLQAETVDGALQRLGKGFLQVLERAKEPKSEMIKLMNSPVDSIEASKLKCVVNYLMHMNNEAMKIQGMCQFFAGVRNCNMGQNTAIQDYYVQLPDENRIRTHGGIFECNTVELPAMQALYRVVETLVSSKFSPESVFMKEICGIKAHEEIMEAAHQINCMKGLIVHLLGSQHGLKFDLNGHLIYENILNVPLQKMMQMFYEHVELGPIVAVVKSSFDALIKAEAGREAKPMYAALNKIHDSYVKKDTLESWLEYKVADDDLTYVPEGITNRGVMRLMQHAGILDEVDAALPW